MMMPHHHHHRGRPSARLRSLRGLVYVTCAGIWLTGALWLLFHYFLRRDSEFGPAANPLEHWWLVAHGAFAFACLWLMGYLWKPHVVQGWKARRHRKTGGTLFGACLLLVVTGYLLYYVADDDWRANLGLLHWVVGLALPLPFAGHWFIRRR